MGDSEAQLLNIEVSKIREFIKENYKEMYIKWISLSDKGFYGE